MSEKTSLSPRTWIEISRAALRSNIKTFRTLAGPKVKLWAVVKSNAYGHGLQLFSKLADGMGIDGFCVDSLVEGVRLREDGVKKPILVIGSTLPELFPIAAANDIVLSLSTFEDLKAFQLAESRPDFHVKLDTGMHRRGFMPQDLPAALKKLASPTVAARCMGIYTHFANAKDLGYPTFAEKQYSVFREMENALRDALPDRTNDIISHVAATGGALMNKKYHRDAIRIGIGLYGYHPSPELEEARGDIALRPILTWKTIVSEVKTVAAGEYVGYNFTERLRRRSRLAVLPIGYWHGFPVALSRVGQVLINGHRARVLGRVSMDLIVVDVTEASCSIGDEVILMGGVGKNSVDAKEFAAAMPATHHYEVLTRLNPLMEHRATP